MKALSILLLTFLLPAGQPLAATPATVELSEAEQAYVRRLGPVRMCIDPDWYPFEHISESGMHEGIAADLLALVSRRTGIDIRLHRTASWQESLAASRSGQCELLSFLNQSQERDRWLIFTRPIFHDPNVILTRASQPDITNLAALGPVTVALPNGTMVKERLESEYPNLRIIPTISEREAINMVASGVADLTIRSLNIAAFTIKQEGLFNLKIAGRIPDYDNALRIGVIRQEPMLRDILDKGVATITQHERNAISNRHAGVSLVTRVDYRLFWEVLTAALLILVLLASRHRKQRQLDAARIALTEQKAANAQRAREEQGRLVAMLSHEVKTPLAMIDGAVQSLGHLVGREQPEIGRRLDRIRRGVRRLENLSDRFLHKDRLDNAALQLRRSPSDLVGLVHELLSELPGNQRIRLNSPNSLIASIDGGLMQMALKNLIVNALNYSPFIEPVTVDIRHDEKQVSVSVRDSGPGVPAELRDKLFDCYVRGNHGSDIPGAGLGLYMAQRIAQLHGGSIRLGETENGSEFILAFPIAQDD